jgi:hypothetical protein
MFILPLIANKSIPLPHDLQSLQDPISAAQLLFLGTAAHTPRKRYTVRGHEISQHAGEGQVTSNLPGKPHNIPRSQNTFQGRSEFSDGAAGGRAASVHLTMTREWVQSSSLHLHPMARGINQ